MEPVRDADGVEEVAAGEIGEELGQDLVREGFEGGHCVGWRRCRWWGWGWGWGGRWMKLKCGVGLRYVPVTEYTQADHPTKYPPEVIQQYTRSDVEPRF